MHNNFRHRNKLAAPSKNQIPLDHFVCPQKLLLSEYKQDTYYWFTNFLLLADPLRFSF